MIAEPSDKTGQATFGFTGVESCMSGDSLLELYIHIYNPDTDIGGKKARYKIKS